MVSGLAPGNARTVYAAIRRLRIESGIAMLVVEQNARLALDFAQSGYLLDRGRVALSGEAGSIAASDLVKESYLGSKAEEGRS